MILADSNLIIYAASGKYPALMDWFAKKQPAVSVISLVETLGYHKLRDEEKAALESLFAELTVVYLSPEIVQLAIHLRQQRVMSLGDSIIAATAINANFLLATHNIKDFEWVETLTVCDPMQD